MTAKGVEAQLRHRTCASGMSCCGVTRNPIHKTKPLWPRASCLVTLRPRTDPLRGAAKQRAGMHAAEMSCGRDSHWIPHSRAPAARWPRATRTCCRPRRRPPSGGSLATRPHLLSLALACMRRRRLRAQFAAAHQLPGGRQPHADAAIRRSGHQAVIIQRPVQVHDFRAPCAPGGGGDWPPRLRRRACGRRPLGRERRLRCGAARHCTRGHTQHLRGMCSGWLVMLRTMKSAAGLSRFAARHGSRHRRARSCCEVAA